jgi:hypothetical protein
MDATVLEEIIHRTPTIQGRQLEDLLMAATAPVALVTALLVMMMLVVE